MRKNLSFLIALAVSLSITTTALADAAPTTSSTNTVNTVSTDNSTVNLTLDDAVNGIEKNNTELKLMDSKIESLYRGYDIAISNKGTAQKTDGSVLSNQYAQAKIKEDITPLNDIKNINDVKNSRGQRLSTIKYDMQRQYMNVVTCKNQIDNINKSMANIDEQINQIEAKIKYGQATSDAIDTLNVQKSNLSYEINDIQDQIDQSTLKIKQYLNIDLSKNVNLTTAKKDYVKFDDKDIESRIDAAVEKDYSLSSIQNNIDILKKQYDIYHDYSHNDFSGETGTQKSIAVAQTSLTSKKVSLKQTLWNAYYSLKSSENAIETQKLTVKSAQDTYDLAKKNLDQGMTDKVTVDSDALDLDKQTTLIQRSIDQYMVSKEELEYMLTGNASAQTSTQSMGDPSAAGY